MVKKILTGEIEMDYAEFGSGSRTLAVLPGLSVRNVTASAAFLERKFKTFAEDHRIFVFDRRNNIGEHYSVEDMAEDTCRVMKALGIESADIFGASQGGMIAMCIAAEHPELVNSMALGSTAARADSHIIAVCDGWVKAARERRRADLAELFLNAVYSKSTADAWRRGALLLAGTYTDEELDHFSVLAESIVSFSVFDRLDAIKIPALVIGSRGDRVVGARASEEIAEKLGCELYMYGDDYGHGVYDEAPDYSDRLLNFFRSVSR